MTTTPPLKTPEELGRSKAHYRDKRILLLVRDPRDVLVSMYFENSRRRGRFEGDLDAFVHQRRGSIDSIITFLNVWGEASRHLPATLIVRYEDLRAHTEAELGRILELVGPPDVEPAVIADAVEAASFENMRWTEETNVGAAQRRLRPGSLDDSESFIDPAGHGRRVRRLPQPRRRGLRRGQGSGRSPREMFGYPDDLPPAVL